MELNPVERRVVGVLIEKALAHPDYYPMTVNALKAGCNQRSNRDPVMALEEAEVLEALDTLRQKGLASVTIRESGRAERWAHNADTAFGLDERDLALLAELLLRGPQTEGELRARASRMRPFESIPQVAEVLQKLSDRDAPLVARMGKEPGRRGIRCRHLLYPEGEEPGESAPAAGPAGDLREVCGRIEALEGDVSGLKEEVVWLRREVETLKEPPPPQSLA
jgi:uncharacterized protein YceH (UPF0502 family)